MKPARTIRTYRASIEGPSNGNSPTASRNPQRLHRPHPGQRPRLPRPRSLHQMMNNRLDTRPSAQQDHHGAESQERSCDQTPQEDLLTGRNHHAVQMRASPIWTAVIPTCEGRYRHRRPRWPRCCGKGATPRWPPVSGIWPRCRNARRLGPSPTGRCRRASTVTTVSSKVRPISSIPS